MPDACRACKAPIVWALTAKDRRIPLDPTPSATGNIVRTEEKPGVYRAAVVASGSQAALYTAHFVTCPSANRFRKARA